MGNLFSFNLACIKCEFTNKIGLDVIIDNKCCQIGDIGILEEKMEHLGALKRDVERQINGCTQREVPDVVETWLTNVGKLDAEVSTSTPSGCFLCSKKKLGTLSKITRADVLINREKDLKDCISRCTTTAKKYIPPSSDPHIVGMEQLMSRVLYYLNDAKVGVVGIHGMGGAGKTTLAKQLINKLQSSPSSPSTSAAATEGQESGKFDHIIFATVSQSLDIAKLQKDIALELRVHENSGFRGEDDESIRADFLRRYLYSRRFLLVLDDVWQKLDLETIGIPQPEEDVGNKIVLTTREAKVCTDMGASPENIVKVGCLEKEESWELFQKTIKWKDGKFKEKGVYETAQEIAAKCGGLPLVLKTIAGALATKEDKGSWENVRDQLKVSPNGIRGMSDVYGLLEVSYNNLEKEEYKSCLLYSALFPEDWEIKIETLVDYCIGGGSVSSVGSSSSSSSIISGGIVELRKRGRFIISELIDACVLERCTDEHFAKGYVKVHDAIRDMILQRIGGQKIISYAGKGLAERTHVVNVEDWQAASMVSLSFNKIEELAMKEEEYHEKPTAQCGAMAEKIGECSSNLRVLLLNSNSHFKNVPGWLFHYFPNLRVLDLSGTGIEEIPESLCSLQSLRHLNLSSCHSLMTLPKEMGNLRNLMQLDICSCLSLMTLPKEVGNLRNLMGLNLSFTPNLCEIPSGLFSSLSKLEFLDLFDCESPDDREKRLQVLKEIGGDLPLLDDVRLSIIGDVRAVNFLVDESESLSNSTTQLYIRKVDDLFEGELFKRMGKRLKKLRTLRIERVHTEELVIDDGHFSELKNLHISHVHSLQHIILKGRALEHLTSLYIANCDEVRDLACLWKLPNLITLYIKYCNEIVEVMGPSQPEGDEIIHNHHHQAILPKLECIYLSGCPKLVRISRSPLQLPSLKYLNITDCPSLKDISIVNSPHEVGISCGKEWWEDLQWAEGIPPPNFTPIFLPYFQRVY